MPQRFSHPATATEPPVPLQNHLEDVARRARKIVPEDATTPAGHSIAALVGWIALVHDAGKLTTWFQQYIGTMDGDPTGPTNHAMFGGCLAHYILEARDVGDESQLAGFLAVAKHHGRLPNTGEYVYERAFKDNRRQTREAVKEQVADVDESVPALADEIVEQASDGMASWGTFVEDIRSGDRFNAVGDHVRDVIARDPEPVSNSFYGTTLQLWSALVLADKTSAAKVPTGAYDPAAIDRETLSEYIDNLAAEASPAGRTGMLNEYRNQARHDVLDNVESFAANEESVGTIRLPTGMGKTLTGLDAALKLRNLTDRNRIVYALPFTSIIDQVADELQTIFDTDETDGRVTLHHHLADTRIALSAEDETPHEDDDHLAHLETMLGESWRGPLTLTTFVQLLESLAGPRNAASMKLPALYDSIVILDEPQAIPHDWWPLVRCLVRLLTEEYGAAVLAMTATQPRIFGEASTELVPNAGQYFEDIERVAYRFEESVWAYPDDGAALSYDEAAERLLETTPTTNSTLAVCNTIDSTNELSATLRQKASPLDIGLVYEELLQSEGNSTGEVLADAVVERDPDLALLSLSTRHRPRDRLRLVEAAKSLSHRDIRLIVVSTQLIEAGVDISFDRVFRDLAPIDSLVQAAGRCNRSFEQDRGLVTAWWLDLPADQDATPAEAVYEKWGDSLVSATLDALSDVDIATDGTYSEPRIASEAVQAYYRQLTEERNVGSQEYVEYLKNGEAATLGELSLIDERLAVDVVVCRTDSDRGLVEKLCESEYGGRGAETNDVYDRIKPLQVSIPVYERDSKEAEVLDTLPQVPDTDLRWVDVRDAEFAGYFDPSRGFVVPDKTVERRFL